MNAPTARYRCPGCGHIYDEAQGDVHEGFPPGTRWTAIPDDWACPDCAVREKPDFVSLNSPACEAETEVAGAR